MTHTLESISGGNLVLVNELYQTRFTVAGIPANALPFVYTLASAATVTAGGIAAGSNVVIHVPDASIYTAGQWIRISDGTHKDFTSIVSVNVGGNTITLKTLVNSYGITAVVYQLSISYDKVLVVDPNVGCTEVTAISLQASVRDQTVVRFVWTNMTSVEFSYMAAQLGVTVSGTRANQVSQIYNALVAASGARPRASGPGVFDQNIFQPDGGEFVSFSLGAFEDQFQNSSGTATFDEYSFEVPFDCFLKRATISTEASTAADAYVTITQNDVTTIVGSGSPPPNRNLPAVGGQKAHVDLANIPIPKGDKITVRLNLVGANTLTRVNVCLAYAARLIPLP